MVLLPNWVSEPMSYHMHIIWLCIYSVLCIFSIFYYMSYVLTVVTDKNPMQLMVFVEMNPFYIKFSLLYLNVCNHHGELCWPAHTRSDNEYSINGDPGPCTTNVIATCRKNFSQWESSFLWKLRCHWLKFLRRVAKTLVIQGPGLL